MNKYIYSLAIRNIMQNKKKYIFIIIGIILSTILMSSTIILIYNFYLTEINNIKNNGNYHFSYQHTDIEHFKDLESDDNIDKGSIFCEYVTNIKSDKFPDLDIEFTGYDNNAFTNIQRILKQGKTPTNSNEIMLEEWVAKRSNPMLNIGDKVEFLINGENKSYTIVGLYENYVSSQINDKIKVVTFLDNYNISTNLDTNNSIFNIYFRIKDGVTIKDKINAYRNNSGGNEHFVKNDQLLRLLRDDDVPSNNWYIIMSLFSITPIILATMIIIYNSLNISLLERAKLFGMLRALGSSKRQIKILVICEVLIISILSIPVGLILGILILKSAFKIFSLNGLVDNITLSPYILLITLVISLISIIFSAYFPARHISRISPIDAIFAREYIVKENIKRKKFNIRIPLNTELELANKNIKRNKKRYLITLSSIIISVMLIILYSSFMNSLIKQINNLNEDNKITYKILKVSSSSQEDFKNLYGEYKQLDGIDKIFKTYNYIFSSIYVPENKINKDYAAKSEHLSENISGEKYKKINTQIYVYDNERLNSIDFNNYSEKGIDINKLNEDGVLILQTRKVLEKDKKTYYKGDILELNEDENIYLNLSKQENNLDIVNLNIAGIIDQLPYSFNLNKPEDYETEKKEFNPEVILIMTESTFNKLIQKNTKTNINLDLIGYDIVLKSDTNNALIDKSIVSITNKQSGNKTVNTMDFGDKASENTTTLTKLLLIFAIFIALIGYANLINTNQSNILVRKREIAMLRAVGTNKKQIKNMIIFEGLILGFKGAVYGSLLGVTLSYYIYSSLVGNTRNWDMPYLLVFACILLSMLIGYISTLIPLRKLNKINIIEAIKCDI